MQSIGDKTLAELLKADNFLIAEAPQQCKQTSKDLKTKDESDLGKYFNDSIISFSKNSHNTPNESKDHDKKETEPTLNESLDLTQRSQTLMKQKLKKNKIISTNSLSKNDVTTLKDVQDCVDIQPSINSNDVSLGSEMYCGGNEKSSHKSSIMELPSIITTQNRLQLAHWGLPLTILRKYESRGVTNMFAWQVECLKNPQLIENSKNLIYSAPTSAGKTLVSEILVIKTILERRKKVIFVLPFVSVVREKMYYFQDLLSGSGVRVEGFMGGVQPPGGFHATDMAIATIEKANSLVNQLMEEGLLENLGAVVIDELHLLGDPHRGYLLELLLTKLKYMSLKVEQINIQLIGMSATLPNLNILAEWLDAELYKTDFRPVPLEELCKIGPKIYDEKLNLRRIVNPLDGLPADPDNVLQLALETILDGHSVLIFCPTKDWCENLSRQISNAFFQLGRQDTTIGRALRDQLNKEAIIETLEQLKRTPMGLDKVLKNTVSFGVAYHHAGLTMDERDVIEGAFRSSALRVLTATSTLSSGVNLPARRVIIRTPIFHGKAIDTLTYKQMIGRAGRMGKDTAGESILVCKLTEKNTATNILNSSLQPIISCLEGPGSPLVRAIIEAVASEVAYTPEDITMYIKCTLLSYTKESNEVEESTKEAIQFLVQNELLLLQKSDIGVRRWVATPLGKACLAASVAPKDGLFLFEELQKARRCFVLDTELHVIYLVTPFNSGGQIGQIDWYTYLDIWKAISESERRVGQLVGVKESFLITALRGAPKAGKILDIHKRFYTALALHDLVREVPLHIVCDKYGCSRGIIQSLQQTAATFAGMVTQFCKKLEWNCIELLVSQFQTRLQFGVCRELLDLLRLSMLNGLRARSLYKEGITTVAELAVAGEFDVERALYKALPFESKKEQFGEDEYETARRNKIRAVFVTGKDGLTPQEAAVLLVKEARNLVKNELGLEELHWDKKDPNCVGRPFEASAILRTDVDMSNISSSRRINELYSRQTSLNKHEESNKVVEQIQVHENVNITTCDKLVERPVITETDLSSIQSRMSSTKQSFVASPILFNDSLDMDSQECNILEQNVLALDNAMFDDTNFSDNLQPTTVNDTENIIKSMKKPVKINTSRVLTPSTLNNVNKSLIWDDSWSHIKSVETTPPAKTYQDKLRQVTKRKFSAPDVNKSPIASVVTYANTRTLSTGSNRSDDDIIIPSQGMDCIGSVKKTRIRMKLESLRSRTQRTVNKTETPNGKLNNIKPIATVTKITTVIGTKRTHESDNKKNTVLCDDCSTQSIVNDSDEEIVSKKIITISKTKIASAMQPKESAVDAAKLKKRKARLPKELSIVNISSDRATFNDFKRKMNGRTEIALAPACKFVSKDTVAIGTKIIGAYQDVRKKIKKIEGSIYNDRKLCGVALSWGRTIYYLSFENVQEPGRVPIKERMLLLTSILTTVNLNVRCFGAKEIYKTLYKCCGLIATAKFLDSLTSDWLLNSEVTEKSFENLIAEHLPAGLCLLQKLGTMTGNLGPGMNINSVATGEIRACTEATLSWFLLDVLLKKLEAINPILVETFKEVEMGSVLLLSRMELTGFGINIAALQELSEVIQKQLLSIQEKAYRLAGKKFNFSSTKNVAQILGLDTGKKICTNKAVLERSQHPIANLVMNWRKLNATFIKIVCPLMSLAGQYSRIHGNCVTNTATGRVSMHEPNLQNVPRDFDVVDNSFVISVRMAFVPAHGNILLSADYCQLELRILAHFSKEPILRGILKKPGDVFRNIAARWFNTAESNIDDTMRQRTKQLCYGMIYGMGVKTLAETLQVEELEARDFLETFMGAYPGIRKWLNKVVEKARINGFVTTLMKRRRILPGINSEISSEKGQAERQAVNSKIQGSAADIAKKAMVLVDERMQREYPGMPMILPDILVKRKLRRSRELLPRGAYLVLQLHDELLYEINAMDLDNAARIIKESMEQAYELTVPLPVKVMTGQAWGDLVEYHFN